MILDAELRANVRDLRAWARARVAHCRELEAKFAAIEPGSNARNFPPQVLVEAWTERQALEAVLRMLDHGLEMESP